MPRPRPALAVLGLQVLARRGSKSGDAFRGRGPCSPAILIHKLSLCRLSPALRSEAAQPRPQAVQVPRAIAQLGLAAYRPNPVVMDPGATSPLLLSSPCTDHHSIEPSLLSAKPFWFDR